MTPAEAELYDIVSDMDRTRRMANAGKWIDRWLEHGHCPFKVYLPSKGWTMSDMKAQLDLRQEFAVRALGIQMAKDFATVSEDKFTDDDAFVRTASITVVRPTPRS